MFQLSASSLTSPSHEVAFPPAESEGKVDVTLLGKLCRNVASRSDFVTVPHTYIALSRSFTCRFWRSQEDWVAFNETSSDPVVAYSSRHLSDFYALNQILYLELSNRCCRSRLICRLIVDMRPAAKGQCCATDKLICFVLLSADTPIVI
jgi:hypothetical protein